MTKGNLALQMPSSYVLMDEEEMCYTEGGTYVGYGTTVTHKTRAAALNYLHSAYVSLSNASSNVGDAGTLAGIAVAVAGIAGGLMVSGLSLIASWQFSKMQALYSSAYTKVYKSSWKKVYITEVVSSGLVTSVSVAKG